MIAELLSSFPSLPFLQLPVRVLADLVAYFLVSWVVVVLMMSLLCILYDVRGSMNIRSPLDDDVLI